MPFSNLLSEKCYVPVDINYTPENQVLPEDWLDVFITEISAIVSEMEGSVFDADQFREKVGDMPEYLIESLQFLFLIFPQISPIRKAMVVQKLNEDMALCLGGTQNRVIDAVQLAKAPHSIAAYLQVVRSNLVHNFMAPKLGLVNVHFVHGLCALANEHQLAVPYNASDTEAAPLYVYEDALKKIFTTFYSPIPIITAVIHLLKLNVEMMGYVGLKQEEGGYVYKDFIAYRKYLCKIIGKVSLANLFLCKEETEAIIDINWQNVTHFLILKFIQEGYFILSGRAEQFFFHLFPAPDEENEPTLIPQLSDGVEMLDGLDFYYVVEILHDFWRILPKDGFSEFDSFFVAVVGNAHRRLQDASFSRSLLRYSRWISSEAIDYILKQYCCVPHGQDNYWLVLAKTDRDGSEPPLIREASLFVEAAMNDAKLFGRLVAQLQILDERFGSHDLRRLLSSHIIDCRSSTLDHILVSGHPSVVESLFSLAQQTRDVNQLLWTHCFSGRTNSFLSEAIINGNLFLFKTILTHARHDGDWERAILRSTHRYKNQDEGLLDVVIQEKNHAIIHALLSFAKMYNQTRLMDALLQPLDRGRNLAQAIEILRCSNAPTQFRRMMNFFLSLEANKIQLIDCLAQCDFRRWFPAQLRILEDYIYPVWRLGEPETFSTCMKNIFGSRAGTFERAHIRDKLQSRYYMNDHNKIAHIDLFYQLGRLRNFEKKFTESGHSEHAEVVLGLHRRLSASWNQYLSSNRDSSNKLALKAAWHDEIREVRQRHSVICQHSGLRKMINGLLLGLKAIFTGCRSHDSSRLFKNPIATSLEKLLNRTEEDILSITHGAPLSRVT